MINVISKALLQAAIHNGNFARKSGICPVLIETDYLADPHEKNNMAVEIALSRAGAQDIVTDARYAPNCRFASGNGANGIEGVRSKAMIPPYDIREKAHGELALVARRLRSGPQLAIRQNPRSFAFTDYFFYYLGVHRNACVAMLVNRGWQLGGGRALKPHPNHPLTEAGRQSGQTNNGLIVVGLGTHQNHKHIGLFEALFIVANNGLITNQFTTCRHKHLFEL